jgi:hypothetical protein
MNKYTCGSWAFTIKLQHDDASLFVEKVVHGWERCVVHGNFVCCARELCALSWER